MDLENDDNIANEPLETIQEILRCRECDNSINVKMIIEMAGSRQGDNYMSLVKRLVVNGTHNKNQNENDTYQRSLIVKRQIPNLARRKLYRCDQAFANEINAYTEITPQFQKIAKTIDLAIPFVDCLFAGLDELGEIVVLEDLRSMGYRMANRLKGLDYAHCKIVVQELGVLHGLSLAAKQLHELEFAKVVSSIHESIYCNEAADFYAQSLDSSLKETIHSLRLSNRKYANLTPAIKQTEQLKGKLYRKMTECILDQPNEWMVLCHGDLWINNLMFRYNERGDCDAVKFIDLQTLRYTSPVIDLLHFFYTSTEYTVRVKYMDQLIDDYVDSLYLTLQKFDVHDLYVSDVDSLNRIIRQELKQRAMYGLGICMWLMPAVTFHPNNVIDLDQVVLDDFTNENHEKTLTSMQTPEYHTRMRDTIMEFYKKGILNEVT